MTTIPTRTANPRLIPISTLLEKRPVKEAITPKRKLATMKAMTRDRKPLGPIVCLDGCIPGTLAQGPRVVLTMQMFKSSHLLIAHGHSIRYGSTCSFSLDVLYIQIDIEDI